MRLPKVFADVKLGDLWEYLKVCSDILRNQDAIDKDLKEINFQPDSKSYWAGWRDCMSTLLGDLTGRPTKKLDPELAEKFENYRMEDKLAELAEEIKRENGL
jgi:hypothetical protein